MAVGLLRVKLYVLKIMEDQVNIASEELESDLFLWHCRLGHLGMDNVIKIANGNMVKGIGHLSLESKPFCEGCVMGKQHRCPYRKGISYRATEPFELMMCVDHSDVCGPMSESSIGGSRYYVTFIDDSTRDTFVYFLKNKSQVLEKFKDFHSYATNASGKGVKTTHTDNGGEYCSKEFEMFLKENGIVHQLTKSRKSIFIDTLKEQKVTNCLIRVLERKFHDFGNKQSVSYDHANDKDVPVAIDNENSERAPDDENVNAGNIQDMNRNNQVGATYEENFLEEVGQVGEKRVRRPPARYVEECHVTSSLTADNIDEPSNVHEATTGEYSSEWKSAMESEYNSLLENDT